LAASGFKVRRNLHWTKLFTLMKRCAGRAFSIRMRETCDESLNDRGNKDAQ
jgi:hypothetical protein